MKKKSLKNRDRMGDPCGVKAHYANFYTPNWRRRRVLLGCVQVEENPPPPAPSDLRDMELPPDWNTMTRLDIKKKGNTEYLPPLPPTLRGLTIENNKLRELPTLPAGLVTLHIEGNNVTVLPRLPSTLTHIYAKKNNLESVTGPLPTTLIRFYITHNQVTELPSLENTEVENVGLGFNNLRALPRFPDTLRNLGCPNNQITEIRNLPTNTRVLNCSNNPLRVLEIENLTHLRTLIATNCELSEIPLLPDIPHGSDGFYFENNPLLPPFQDAYVEYNENRYDAGAYTDFRDAVLTAHRDLIASRKANVTAVQEVFKAPMAGETGQNWYYGPQPTAAEKVLKGNFGPTNLIAQFLTGKKGTLESQKLGLLENEERLGMRDEGSAAAARQRIADVAVQGGPMAKKAELYVRPENLAAARERQVAAAAVPPPPPEEEEIVNALQGGSRLTTGHGGGKGKHRTPRNRKSSRHTRKH